jgi:hypothetical protein
LKQEKQNPICQKLIKTNVTHRDDNSISKNALNNTFSFNKLHLQMEELEQKHLHLLQVVESEKTAKWQYTQHCEELTKEIKKLRTEV